MAESRSIVLVVGGSVGPLERNGRGGEGRKGEGREKGEK